MKIDYVALLARLELSDTEKELFSRQVQAVIAYIDKLNELDTSDVEPTAHVLPLKNVFREDTPGDSLSRDSAPQNAPEKGEAFYRVPQII